MKVTVSFITSGNILKFNNVQITGIDDGMYSIKTCDGNITRFPLQNIFSITEILENKEV